jgi:hypothetical protein
VLAGLLAPAPSAFGAAAETITGIGGVLVRVHAASFTATELEWPSTWLEVLGSTKEDR